MLEGVGGRAAWDPAAAARLESAVAAVESSLESRSGQRGRMDWRGDGEGCGGGMLGWALGLTGWLDWVGSGGWWVG